MFYSLLISYATDRGNPDDDWKGYVYAVSMFLVAIVMTIIIHQYWQIVFVLGMRIRTAIIGMVYAKVPLDLIIDNAFKIRAGICVQF